MDRLLIDRIERRQPDTDRRQGDRRQPAWVSRLPQNAKDLTRTVAA